MRKKSKFIDFLTFGGPYLSISAATVTVKCHFSKMYGRRLRWGQMVKYDIDTKFF